VLVEMEVVVELLTVVVELLAVVVGVVLTLATDVDVCVVVAGGVPIRSATNAYQYHIDFSIPGTH
jgi:hypothetical protein